MKKALPIIFCCLLQTIFCFPQSGNWQWAGLSGPGNAKAVATDKEGNVYITGQFSDTAITFGDSTILLNNGMTNVFIAKYSPSGTLLWAQSPVVGLHTDARGYAIATDGYSNVYVTGTYESGPLTFGAFTVGLTTYAVPDMFLVKFDSAGNVQWAQRGGDSLAAVYPSSIAADPNGNTYITGSFIAAPLTLGTYQLYSNPNDIDYDIFIVKYDNGGNVVWARTADTASSDVTGIALALDEHSNLYLSCFLHSAFAVFDSVTINSDASHYSFILKCDSNGKAQWAKLPDGNNQNQEILGIASDRNGHIYATGYFMNGTIGFDSLAVVGNTQGHQTVFVAKLSDSGNALWVRGSSGNSSTIALGYGIAATFNGEVAACGNFDAGSIVFDGDTLPYPPGTDPYPAYVVTFDSTGALLCWDVLPYGGFEHSAVCFDANSNIYLAGALQDYDTLIVAGDTLIASGTVTSDNIIVARFSCSAARCQVSTTTIDTAICQGDTFYVANHPHYSTGTSTDTLLNGTGCDSLVILTLSVKAVPPVTLDTVWTTQGGTFITVSPANGTQYLWQSALLAPGEPYYDTIAPIDTNFIGISCNEAGLSVYYPHLDTSYLLGFFFKVNITLQNGCIDTSTWILLHNCITAVQQITDDVAVSISPNPFITQAVASYSLPSYSKTADLIVYDVLGRERDTYKLPNTEGQVAINANNLSAGVYFYSLVVDSRVLVTRKIIVE